MAGCRGLLTGQQPVSPARCRRVRNGARLSSRRSSRSPSGRGAAHTLEASRAKRWLLRGMSGCRDRTAPSAQFAVTQGKRSSASSGWSLALADGTAWRLRGRVLGNASPTRLASRIEPARRGQGPAIGVRPGPSDLPPPCVLVACLPSTGHSKPSAPQEPRQPETSVVSAVYLPGRLDPGTHGRDRESGNEASHDGTGCPARAAQAQDCGCRRRSLPVQAQQQGLPVRVGQPVREWVARGRAG